ncbi:hypothetical protein OK016_29205 [Vibrio chagasii]|nr:hypothetical protein [Vibrio chagasii]
MMRLSLLPTTRDRQSLAWVIFCFKFGSREVHMFARGVTRVLQEAQKASVDAGVDKLTPVKVQCINLLILIWSSSKAKTDRLSHGASGTDGALEQLGKGTEAAQSLAEDIDGSEIVVKPPAPKAR